jgi:hypothetical protein
MNSKKQLLAQNISRHRRQHHPDAASPPPLVITETEEQAEEQVACQSRAGPSARVRQSLLWDHLGLYD